jgi:hypothetical protein
MMAGKVTLMTFALMMLLVMAAFIHNEVSLDSLTPENYFYKEAERCSTCKGDGAEIMHRAVGVAVTGEYVLSDDRGWLVSEHAQSQSHEDKINTACAWCHAPLTENAVKDEADGQPIAKGNWQGVSCGACHPGELAREQRKSLVINFKPGSSQKDPAAYIFRDRSDGKAMNQQCKYCHHEFHDMLKAKKTEMLDSGELRCIDCHMAAHDKYLETRVERFHNLKVADNIPHSCAGMGSPMNCHSDKSLEWMSAKVVTVKGSRKEW